MTLEPIHLRDIPAEGLRREFDLSGSFASAALEGTEVETGASSVQASLDLHRSGHEVLARGSLDGELALVCSRCAGEARVLIDAPIEVVFLPRGAQAPDTPDDDDPDLDQPDIVHYDDDKIDVAEVLREELLLALPIAPLCSETCKGLCGHCGTDLNQGACGCPEEPRDDRWSALRNVKLD